MESRERESERENHWKNECNGKRRPYELGGVSGLEFGSRTEYITRGASNGVRPVL